MSPDVTDQGKAYMVGMAIGAGLIGLAVAGATAPRAYSATPISVELTPLAGGAR